MAIRHAPPGGATRTAGGGGDSGIQQPVVRPPGPPDSPERRLCRRGRAIPGRPAPCRGWGGSAGVPRWADFGDLSGRDSPARRGNERKERMNTTENVDTILEIFKAIERRDFERLLTLCQPDVEFVWPPSLPYAGGERGA